MNWKCIRAKTSKLLFESNAKNKHCTHKCRMLFASIEEKNVVAFLENVWRSTYISINRQKSGFHFADDGEQMLAVFLLLSSPFLCVQFLFFNDHLKDGLYFCRQSIRFVPKQNKAKKTLILNMCFNPSSFSPFGHLIIHNYEGKYSPLRVHVRFQILVTN